MGGAGSGRKVEVKENRTPIMKDMFLPNLSGARRSGDGYKTYLYIDGSNANQTIDINSQNIKTTGSLQIDGNIQSITAGGVTFDSSIHFNEDKTYDIGQSSAMASKIWTNNIDVEDKITSSTGTIDFDNDNTTTTGAGTFGSLAVDTFLIDGNKISTSAGTVDFDDDNITTTGKVTAKDLEITKTTYPVAKFLRGPSNYSADTLYWGIQLEIQDTTPSNNQGIGFVFKGTDSVGTSTTTGVFGGVLTNYTQGSEIGALKFLPAYHGVDPAAREDMVIEATGAATSDLKLTGVNQYFIGENSGLCYGSFYGNEIAWSQATAVQNTWYNISDSDIADGQLNNVTHDGNGKLTVSKAGRYLVNYSASAEVSVANKHIEAGIEVSSSGSAVNDGRSHINGTTANEQFNLSSTAILDLAASATLEIAIRTTDAGTPNLSVDHVNMTITQIGGT